MGELPRYGTKPVDPPEGWIVFEVNGRADQAVDELNRSGVECVQLGAFHPGGRYSPYHAARVAVPAHQADEGRALLLEWERQNESDVERHVAELKRQLVSLLLVPLALPVAAALAFLIAYPDDAEAPWGLLPLLWVAGFIVALIRLQIVRGRRPADGPPDR